MSSPRRNQYDSLGSQDQWCYQDVAEQYRDVLFDLQIQYNPSNGDFPQTIKPKQPDLLLTDFNYLRLIPFGMTLKHDGHGACVAVHPEGLSLYYRKSNKEDAKLTLPIQGHFRELAATLRAVFLAEIVITCDGKSTGHEGVTCLFEFAKSNPGHRIAIKVVIYWIHSIAGQPWNRFTLDEINHPTPWDFIRECVDEDSTTFSVVDHLLLAERNGAFQCPYKGRTLTLPSLSALQAHLLRQADALGEEGYVAWCPRYRDYLDTHVLQHPKCTPAYQGDSPRTDLACKVRSVLGAKAVCLRCYICYQDTFACFLLEDETRRSLTRVCTLNMTRVHPEVRGRLQALQHIGNFEAPPESMEAERRLQGLLIGLQFSGMSSTGKLPSHKYVRGPVEGPDLSKITVLPSLRTRHWKATTRALSRARRIRDGSPCASDADEPFTPEEDEAEAPALNKPAEEPQKQSAYELDTEGYMDEEGSEEDETMRMLYARRREMETSHQPMDYELSQESVNSEQPPQAPPMQAGPSLHLQAEPEPEPQPQPEPQQQPQREPQQEPQTQLLPEPSVYCQPEPLTQTQLLPEPPSPHPLVWDSFPVERHLPREVQAGSMLLHLELLVSSIYRLLNYLMLPAETKHTPPAARRRPGETEEYMQEIFECLVVLSRLEARKGGLDDLNKTIEWRSIVLLRDSHYALRNDLVDRGSRKGLVDQAFIRTRLLKTLPQPKDPESVGLILENFDREVLSSPGFRALARAWEGAS